MKMLREKSELIASRRSAGLVPIRNLDVLHAWGDREPALSSLAPRRSVVLRLNDRPWQAPSEPLTENVGQATEIRFAKVPDSDGIEVFYEHESGLVTILLVSRNSIEWLAHCPGATRWDPGSTPDETPHDPAPYRTAPWDTPTGWCES